MADQDPAVPADRLAGLRGAPFTQDTVNKAVAVIRKECEWIIGPRTVETRRLDTSGRALQLPTLHLHRLISVRDGDNPEADPIPMRRLRVYDEGEVKIIGRGRLPEFVEVEFEHGYEQFPDDLLMLVASKARDAKTGRIRSESLASRSITLEAGAETRLASSLLDKYRLSHGSSA